MDEKQMIEFWKTNEKPFGLCPKEAQEWLHRHDGEVECYYGQGWGRQTGRGVVTNTYRIPADYQLRPAGRWVECEVTPNGMVYMFFHRGHWRLASAPGMVGFGGVRYEDGEEWFELGCQAHRDGAENMRPLRPVAVRLWVEE